jgi:hypothetical protein
MEQSLSLEAKQFSAYEETPHILSNPKFITALKSALHLPVS